jgi:rhamnogalacturonyl hydrolase YesR
MMINKMNETIVDDIQKVDSNTIVKPGDFRLTSYEWGVVYSALQRAKETTGDSTYSSYVKSRFDFLAKWIPIIKKVKNEGKLQKENYLFRQPIEPKALDDAGAICAAMAKATLSGLNNNLLDQINVYSDFVIYGEYRLKDKTLARNRPHSNTMWLDDLYMGVPTIAYMGKLHNKNKYYDDAVHQVLSYTKRMFNKNKGLYIHGYVEGKKSHQEFHWARANGWALLAMSDLLDVLYSSFAISYPTAVSYTCQGIISISEWLRFLAPTP